MDKKSVSNFVKTVKVRRKKENKLNDASFIDENPDNFFNVSDDKNQSELLDENGNFKPRSFIGTNPSVKSPVLFNLNDTAKRLVRGQTLKLPKTIDNEKRFQEILIQIEKNKKKSDFEHVKYLNDLSPRERVVSERQKKIIENFEYRTQYWKNIEKNLSERTLKPADRLLSSIKHESSKIELEGKDLAKDMVKENLHWYLTLRNTNENEQEAYVPFGKTSGLYTRVKASSKEREAYSPSAFDLDELQVIGLSKLPLEIEAVKSREELLDLDLIDRTNFEEIIEEQYDKKYLASNL